MIEAIFTYFSGTWGMVELAGTLASLICVYLAVKQNQWTWFWGIIGVLLFGALFFQFKLYSDAGLQILFFLPMQVYGFFKWRDVANKMGFSTVLTMGHSFLFVIGGILVFSGINGYFMAEYTDASFPYVDAFTTWMSIFAQILMAKKFLESWALWVTMDAVAIGVYFAKGLLITSSLYVIFFFLAAYGFYMWYQERNGNVQNVSF